MNIVLPRFVLLLISLALLTACSPVSKMHKAVMTGDLKTTKQLIDDGESLSQVDSMRGSLLCMAAQYDQVEMIHFLVRHGAPVNEQDQYGITAFHCAKTDKAVKALIDAGGDPFIKSHDGVSPLALAVRKGHFSSAKAFIELGLTDVSWTGNNQYSALDYAIAECHVATVELVLQHKLAEPKMSMKSQCKN